MCSRSFYCPQKSWYLVIALQMRRRADHIIHGIGKVVQVVRVQPGHGDTSILGLRDS